MTTESDFDAAVKKLTAFTEFFLTLGDLDGPKLIIAIGERDPEFTYYLETVADRCETVFDFIRIYGNWNIDRMQRAAGSRWRDVINAYKSSVKYAFLRDVTHDIPLLWDELEERLG